MITQRTSGNVRVTNVGPMDAREMDREVRAIWENIAEEYGDRRGMAGLIARTYMLGRAYQRYAAAGHVSTEVLLAVPRFLYNIIARSRGMALA